MPKYRKRPVEVEAEQYRVGEPLRGVCQCAQDPSPHLHTIHAGQVVRLEDRDYVLPEPDGVHFYPVKPDVFEKTYDLADDEPVSPLGA